MKSGKKAIILLVILVAVIGGVFLNEHMQKQKMEEDRIRREEYVQERERHEQELIQMVKDTEIGDGVILSDGIRAYCGTSGDWSASNNTVFLEAYGTLHWIVATFDVNEDTEMVDLVEFDSDLRPANIDELEDVFRDMIQATKQ